MHSLLTCRRPPLDAVRALHDADPSILAGDGDGGKAKTDLWDRTPLFYAVEWNDVPDPDPDPDPDRDGDGDDVAASSSSSSSAVAAFRFVVDASGGDAVDLPDRNGRTPISRLWEKSLEGRCRRLGLLSFPSPPAEVGAAATSREEDSDVEASTHAQDGVVCVTTGSGLTGGDDNTAGFGTNSEHGGVNEICSDCCDTRNSHTMLRRLLGGDWIKMECMLRSRARSFRKVGGRVEAERDDFPILRAALSLRHCPRGLSTVLVRFFPEQAAEKGEGGDGRLPLHLALASSVRSSSTGSSPHEDRDRDRDRPTVIELLLRAHPGAAAVPDPEDARGRLPLAIAVEAGLDWEDVIGPLLDAYPPSVSIPQPMMLSAAPRQRRVVNDDDHKTALGAMGDVTYLFPPFLLAAVAAARRDGGLGPSSSDDLVERAEDAERAWREIPTLCRRTVLRARREEVRRDLGRLTFVYRLLASGSVPSRVVVLPTGDVVPMREGAVV